MKPSLIPRLVAAATTLLLISIVGCGRADRDGQPEAASPPYPATERATEPSTNASTRPDDLCHPPPLLTPAEFRSHADQTAGTAPTALPAATAPGPALTALSGTVEATSCDSGVDGSAYDFVAVQQWAADTTIQGGRTTSSIVVFEEQRWRAADASGRVISVRYRSTPGPPSAPETSDVRYPPGSLPAVIQGPIATDATQLADQFDRAQPRRMGPQSVLRAYADLSGWHATTPQMRRAILTVLATTDGLRHHPGVVDRAGRTGVGVSVDSDQGNTRDLLILHPATGEVLAYEHTVVDDRAQHGTTPRVENYVLFLAHSTTASTEAGTR